MNIAKVFTTGLELKLTKRLDERHPLDISNGAPELDYADLGNLFIVGNRNKGNSFNPFLNSKIRTTIILIL